MMSNRVVLVTGAARGIGAAICRNFSGIGYDIVINYYKSAEQAKLLLEEISRHCQAYSFQADVSRPEDVNALFEFCLQKFGRLDVLVNNASYSFAGSWSNSFENIHWAEWQKTIDVDVKGTMLCSHAANRIMQT